MRRICVLSAVRIHAIVTLDYTDFSYSVVPDGVYSVLEPCLGVVNASLPVLQPVVQKLSHSRIFSLRRTTGVSSTSTPRKKRIGNSWSASGEETKPKRFHRLEDAAGLDDHVPLADVHISSNVADMGTVKECV